MDDPTYLIVFVFSNSSALPSVGEMQEMGQSTGSSTTTKKDVTRKNSVMLPNGAQFMDGKTGSSLAAAGSSVIGGIDNYKRYQMLVSQSTNIRDHNAAVDTKLRS